MHAKKANGCAGGDLIHLIVVQTQKKSMTVKKERRGGKERHFAIKRRERERENRHQTS